MQPIQQKALRVLLADDDADDRLFFAKALQTSPITNKLITVNDGEQLMNYLFANKQQLPAIIFLDLNMPRKTGFECLTEIKENNTFKNISVVVFSTSYPKNIHFEENMINMLSSFGAENYIRKPHDFTQLKELIHTTLTKHLKVITAGPLNP